MPRFLGNFRPVRFRPLRFRLRTLLAGMLLFGLGLALVHRAHEQRRGVQAFAMANPGAVLLYDYQLDAAGEIRRGASPPGPEWLRQRLGLDYFTSVAGADVFYPTDADLRCLARFPALRRVNLQRAVDLTDAGLKPLTGLKHLKLLVIREADQLTDAGLATIAQCRSLDELELEPSPRMTPRGLEQLRAALPGCRVQFVSGELDTVARR